MQCYFQLRMFCTGGSHTRQPNWWSVHQRRLATSCCPPFRQPPTSYKACVYQLGCLVWWLNPACSHERYTTKPLLSLHRKGLLGGCSWWYKLYFCVSKPSSGRRLHEAETSSRLTNAYSNNTGCPIDVCQQEQLKTVWNQRDLSQGESLNVHCW
jgi:hypothetical protein